MSTHWLAAIGGLLLTPLFGWLASRSAIWTSAGVVAAGGALLFVGRPTALLEVFTFTVPFSPAQISVPFGYVDLCSVFAAAMIGLWCLIRLVRPQGLRLPQGWLLLAVFVALNYLSYRLGVAPEGKQGFFLRFLLGVATIFPAVDLMRTERQLRRMVWLLALGAAINAAVALISYRGGGRLGGLADQPNLLGRILCVGFISAIGLLAISRGALPRAVLLGVAALTGASIILTVSRATYLGTGVALLWWTRASLPRSLLVAVVVAAAFYTAGGESRDLSGSVTARLRAGTSVRNRISVARNAVQAIVDRPLIGVGFGQFQEAHRVIDLTSQYRRTAHNYYLSVAAEAGLPALLTFCIFVGLIFQRLRRHEARARAADDPDRSNLYRILLAQMVGWVVMLGFGSAGGMLLYGMVAVFAAAAALPERELPLWPSRSRILSEPGDPKGTADAHQG